jgi:hypothetical protein
MASEARVTLHVFSGRPDPGWSLSQVEAVEFSRRIEQLAEAPVDAIPPEPGLGYRGVEVSIWDESCRTALTVRQGYVVVGAAAFKDARQDLERWLLTTASGNVEPTLLRSILAQLPPKVA